MKNKELDLFKVLIPAIDNNMKELYTVASEDGKKDIKGDLWNLNRYISNIQGTRTQQEVAVFKTNEFYNKNWKTDEVELLARISTKKELKQLAEDHEINIKL